MPKVTQLVGGSKLMGTQVLEFYFGQPHSQHFKGSEILDLADAWKAPGPMP